MQGIGERLSLLRPLPKLPIVLVNPNCRLETKDVFGAFRGNYSEPIDSYLLEKSWSQEKLENLLNRTDEKESKIFFLCRPARSSQTATKLDSCSKGDFCAYSFLHKKRAHAQTRTTREHTHNTRSRTNKREDVFRVLAFVRSLFEV